MQETNYTQLRNKKFWEKTKLKIDRTEKEDGTMNLDLKFH